MTDTIIALSQTITSLVDQRDAAIELGDAYKRSLQQLKVTLGVPDDGNIHARLQELLAQHGASQKIADEHLRLAAKNTTLEEELQVERAKNSNLLTHLE